MWYKDPTNVTIAGTILASLGIVGYTSLREGDDPNVQPPPKSTNYYDVLLREMKEFDRTGIPPHLRDAVEATKHIDEDIKQFESQLG